MQFELSPDILVHAVAEDPPPFGQAFAPSPPDFLPPCSMPTGTIKKKTDKGFGFIAIEGGADVFFHLSACGGPAGFDALNEGQTVTFDLTEGQKGPKAENVVAV